MRLATLILLILAAAIAAAFAVANRQIVILNLDPFSLGALHLSLTLPLFLLVFLSFLLGVLVGGATIALKLRGSARRKQATANDFGNVLADTGRTHTNESKK